MPRGDGPFQIIKRINDNAYDNYFINHTILNKDLGDITFPDQAQPSRKMTQSMTQDPGLGYDHSLASASKLIIPQRITRSRAHVIVAEHRLVSLFVISVD